MMEIAERQAILDYWITTFHLVANDVCAIQQCPDPKLANGATSSIGAKNISTKVCLMQALSYSSLSIGLLKDSSINRSFF